MASYWFESGTLDVKGKSLPQLYRMRTELYAYRDRKRHEVMYNGAETFTKYGPEFTHKIDTNLDRVKEEIRRQERAKCQDSREKKFQLELRNF